MAFRVSSGFGLSHRLPWENLGPAMLGMKPAIFWHAAPHALITELCVSLKGKFRTAPHVILLNQFALGVCGFISAYNGVGKKWERDIVDSPEIHANMPFLGTIATCF